MKDEDDWCARLGGREEQREGKRQRGSYKRRVEIERDDSHMLSEMKARERQMKKSPKFKPE